ncbi:MAG: hypothetical protein IGS48_04430 [Oscillatoriales cyanobacterium C42_A2020_001]|nr:hypothetical protein [Leptolyngbyaceae cyanobacterium C42_A2020_001]
MTRERSKTVWSYKPWWCQPWSIGLTGMGSISGSWWLLHRVWLTGLVTVLVFMWMGFFLLVYPKLFAEAIQQELGATEQE